MGESEKQGFQLSFNRFLRVAFQGSRVTSDGGLILVRELDERLGFSKLIAQHLTDSRRMNTKFALADLVRQSVYSRLAGYEDMNDAERVSQDPTFRLIGSEKIWERGAALTSRLQSFETELLTQEENLAGLAAINRELIAKAVDSRQRVVLDLDSTEIPVYGEQEQSAYNGHFESTCYHPLLLFNRDGDCLAAQLRPGNVHSAEGWEKLLLPEIDRQQRRGKEIAFRADAAFAKPEVYEALEERGVKYAIRIPVRFYNKRGTAEQWIKEGKQAVKMTRLSCHKFRSNEVRLWLTIIAYNLGNLWRRLVLPQRIEKWSLMSLQQRLVKTGGRLVKHARYYWLLPAEGHLTRRLFASMLGRIDGLALPSG